MNKKDFVLELYNKGQIGIYPDGIEWKDRQKYYFRFDGGRTIEKHEGLLEICAEQMKPVIDTIAPGATHICGIPDAGNPLAKKISEIYGLECIAYNKSWHALYDFAGYTKSRGKNVDFELSEFMPHGSYGELKGNIEDGAEIVVLDNVISSTAASKFEAEKILEKLLKPKGLVLGEDVEIAGFGILQNNSPHAYEVLKERKIGAVLTAPETFCILRQEGFLNDNDVYSKILDDLFRLGWFTEYATKERVGDRNLYRKINKDFREMYENSQRVVFDHSKQVS